MPIILSKAKRGGASESPADEGEGERFKRTRVGVECGVDSGSGIGGAAAATALESRSQSDVAAAGDIALDWNGGILCQDWFLKSRGGYLSFGDLRSLSATSKAGLAAVRGRFGLFPPDVRDFIRAGEAYSSVTYVALTEPQSEDKDPPILKFSFGSLTYDDEGDAKGEVCDEYQNDIYREDDRIKGEIWEEVAANNAQPRGLATKYQLVCTVSDNGTRFFVCGGENLSNGAGQTRISTITTAIFDIETGVWEELPEVPLGLSFPTYKAGICRLDSKIFIIGGRGGGSVICFDLVQGEWIDSGCENMPSPTLFYSCFAAKLDDNTILVLGRDWLGVVAFTLDVKSGRWARLDDPSSRFRYAGLSRNVECVTNADHSIVIFSDGKWARLLPSRSWEEVPDLSDFDAKVLSIHETGEGLERAQRAHIFNGNGWQILPWPRWPNDLFGHNYVLLRLQA